MLDRLDHLVITVRDVDATCRFYADALGMRVVTFGEGRIALTFGRQKLNVHPLGGSSLLVAASPTAGSADLCFLTDAPLDRWIAHLTGLGVKLIAGPVPRTGAEGPIESIYFRDPDGNLVEVSNAVAATRDVSRDEIAPLREWLTKFSAHVRAVDFDGGRAMCDPELVAFGTVAEFVGGIDRVMAEQWRRVWPTIREFTIRADQAIGSVSDDQAWVAAPWDSLGTRPDGSTFRRPGRATIAFVKRDGRWLATHTHFSLSPSPA
jgi:catechol 2,3-dioxygenase-like lactoylglutathione lyase family enzyme/ketosteroid isomerase-like protein